LFWNGFGYQNQGQIGYYQNSTPRWNGSIRWAMYTMSGVNVTPGTPYSPTALVGNTYSYDKAGRILGSNFGFYSQNTGNGVWNWYGTNMYDESGYQYDASGNITAVQRYGSTGALMDNLGYTYATGTNRLRHISDGVAAGTFASDIDNQVTDNYAYDANGSMQKDLQRDVAFVVNDIHNLPVSMWKASTGQELKYYYDTEGKRIRKDVSSPEYYVNGPGGETEAVVKSDASGATHNILGRDNLGQVKRSGTAFARYYYLKDHLGTIKMTVDGSCNVVGYDDYYPFGQQMDGRSSASSADPRYKFTEKERDAESGYDYFGARYYDARSARWLSVDPMSASFPSWTPYKYGCNNPLTFNDPSGKADARIQQHADAARNQISSASEHARQANDSRSQVLTPLIGIGIGYSSQVRSEFVSASVSAGLGAGVKANLAKPAEVDFFVGVRGEFSFPGGVLETQQGLGGSSTDGPIVDGGTTSLKMQAGPASMPVLPFESESVLTVKGTIPGSDIQIGFELNLTQLRRTVTETVRTMFYFSSAANNVNMSGPDHFAPETGD
jgi:RHS repeat-associated protein